MEDIELIENFIVDENYEELEKILMKNPELVNSSVTHDMGYQTTLLCFACWEDVEFTECIRILLKYGADPNGKDEFGRTPLFECCKLEAIKLLLNYGANINHKDCYGKTPLRLCIEKIAERNFQLSKAILLLKEGASLEDENFEKSSNKVKKIENELRKILEITQS